MLSKVHVSRNLIKTPQTQSAYIMSECVDDERRHRRFTIAGGVKCKDDVLKPGKAGGDNVREMMTGEFGTRQMDLRCRTLSKLSRGGWL